jgi:hypothetical protein
MLADGDDNNNNNNKKLGCCWQGPSWSPPGAAADETLNPSSQANEKWRNTLPACLACADVGVH